jgi:hypothetical protein
MPCHLQLCVVLRSSTSKLSCAHYIYVVALWINFVCTE